MSDATDHGSNQDEENGKKGTKVVTAVEAAHADPAASMLLLTNIEKFALDPSYRQYAEKGRRTKRSPLLTLLIFVGVVSLAWISTVSALNLREGYGPQADPRSLLSAQVQETSQRVDELEIQVEQAKSLVRGAEVSEGFSVAMPPPIAVASAYTKVEGPGVVLTLEDGSSATRNGLVRDTDLRTVMNLLWAGGAEAISIDGRRVGPGTTVRTAGSVILVNLNPVSSPYVVEAIGDPATLLEALQTGEGLTQVRNIEKSLGSSITPVRQEKLVAGALPLPALWSIETGEGGGSR